MLDSFLANDTIALINKFDIEDVVNDFIKQHPQLSDFTNQIVEQYCEFMQKAKTEIALDVPNDAVDLLWHIHMYHTISYFKFCDMIAGKYIHHTPSCSKYSSLKIASCTSVTKGCKQNDEITILSHSKGCKQNDEIAALAA
jgi:hypothetical protein